jgi:lycopene beta-cyclase
LWKQRAFFRMLNRMLFLAAVPDQRWRVLQRFYRLPGGLIGRFYAAKLTPLDKARILFGSPPVPVTKAMWAMSEQSLRGWSGKPLASIETGR